jgi:shikimate dehydrogenase
MLEQDPITGPALILGDGGASRAVAYVLTEMGIACTLLSRKPISGKNPLGNLTLLSWEHAKADLLHRHPLIIQCTPVGMWPIETEAPPLPPGAMEGIGPHHRIMDLIYRPERTLFLEQCAASGARVMGGWTMLEEQAIASLDFWKA